MLINKFNFVETCVACPEQYDVYNAIGERVAYVRLRHGELTASIGGCSLHPNFELYYHDFDDEYKGDFSDDTERTEYLTKIAEAIDKRCDQDRVYFPQIMYVLFEAKDVRPILVRYWLWKDLVHAGDLQQVYDDLVENDKAPTSDETLEKLITRVFRRFDDKVIEWEIVDYGEVC